MKTYAMVSDVYYEVSGPVIGAPRAIQIVTIDDAADITTMFHPDVTLVACANTVNVGDIFTAPSTFAAPAAPAITGAQLAAFAASARYNTEMKGITVSGIAVATDDRSKQMIMGARIAAVADSTFTTPWVASDGTITSLNATQVIAISNAVLAHVQACFTTFANVVSDITAGTITTFAQITAAFAAITA